MDVVLLSRIQFALTIMFHYLFPPLTIGMGVVLVYLDWKWLRTGSALYESAAKFWTKIFALNFAIGVAVGNVIIGISLDARGDFTGSILDQLNPYALSVGVLTVAVFAMHGAIFLYLKTTGELQERLRSWIWRTFFFFLAVYLAVSIFTLIAVPGATENFTRLPLAWIVPILNVLAIANIPRAIHLRRPGYAFVSSSATIAALVFLFGVALFPNLVVSSPNPEHSY